MRGRRTLREALEKEVCFVKTTWDELMRYAPEQEIPLPRCRMARVRGS